MSEFLSPRQELVKVVFKRAHRLEIWGAVLGKEIEPPELFTATDIHDEVLSLSETPHPSRSMVGDEFDELNRVKMIARLSPEKTKNIQFARLDHPLWPLVEFAIRIFDTIGPDGGADWRL